MSPSDALEIDGLSKRYGEAVALSDMTFDVRSGEIFGSVGSNGAGKTTTMRIALGVLSPDAGQVRWAGRPVDLNTRRHIGYMPGAARAVSPDAGGRAARVPRRVAWRGPCRGGGRGRTSGPSGLVSPSGATTRCRS